MAKTARASKTEKARRKRAESAAAARARGKKAWRTRRAKTRTEATDTAIEKWFGAVTGIGEKLHEWKTPGSYGGEEPLRAQVLRTGINLTLGQRNQSYGDPLTNFTLITDLKRLFWDAMHASGKSAWQNSAFGHSIDMVLANLARIATSPSTHLEMDRYVDGANYLAIAYEVGNRTAPSQAEK